MNLNFFRNIFTYTRKEKNGILVLLSVILLIVALNYLIPLFIYEDNTDFSGWKSEIDDFYLNHSVNKSDSITPVLFFPNKISHTGLIGMGISEKVARNWINYLNAGGKFKSAKDVKKIYGLTPGLYMKIEDFMVFETKNVDIRQKKNIEIKDTVTNEIKIPEPRKQHSYKKKIDIVELNIADSASLEALPGLGPVLSGRIVKYRTILGGFCSIDQLKEVYGLKNEYLIKALPYIKLEKDRIKKIRINFLSKNELAKHPYISYSTANKIIKIRSEGGKINEIDEIIRAFPEGGAERVEPYLSFN